MKIKKTNFEWWITNDMIFEINVKKTLYNRYKWWISTKLFLPGKYRWTTWSEK